MASKTISTILNLKDNFSKTIKKATGNSKEFKREIKHIKNQASQMKKSITGAFSGTAMKVGGVVAGLGIVSFAKDSLMLASNLKEVQNVVDTTFGSASKNINVFAKNAGKQFGLSELQAKGFNGTLGAMMKTSGITGKALSKMTMDITGLTGDIASFRNMSPEEAFEKLKSIVNGSSEPVEALGLDFRVASLQAYALSKGIKKKYSEMSNAEQIQLRYNYTMEKTKDMQGDYAKTNTGFANSLRTLQIKFKDIGAKIMSFTIPAFEKLFAAAIKILNGIKIQPFVDKLTELWNKFHVGDLLQQLKVVFFTVFGEIKNMIINAKQPVLSFVSAVSSFAVTIWSTVQPAVQYIVKNIVPTVWDKVKTAIKGILKAATDTFNFITKNWETIKPLILGVALAWGVYKGVMLTMTAVTKAIAIAQWALNVAMNANPVGLIITGIGLLIGAGYLLVKNWDIVKAKAFGLWQGIKSAFAPLSGFFSGMWSGIKEGFRGFINVLTNGINKFTGMLTWIPQKLSKVPGFGWAAKFQIPKIPSFALGTQYFKGGLARTDERGGEIKEYPNGTKIIPADKSAKMLGGKNINVNVTIQGNVIGNKQFIDEVGTVISNKVVLALANM